MHKYFSRPLGRNKALEVGYQTGTTFKGFDCYLHINSRGNHAGLSFCVQLRSYMFEFNLHDIRHWNYEAERWFLHGEEPQFEGYPHE